MRKTQESIYELLMEEKGSKETEGQIKDQMAVYDDLIPLHMSC